MIPSPCGIVPSGSLGQSAGVKNARKDRGIGAVGSAITQSHVTLTIHRDTTHPAMDAVGQARRISALLEDYRTAIWTTQFPPANA